jgi:calcineurin-like phosphoesterase
MFRLWFIADVVAKIGYAGGPASCPGLARGAFEAGDVQLGVANVKGRVFVKEDLRSPFEAADQVVTNLEASGRSSFW